MNCILPEDKGRFLVQLSPDRSAAHFCPGGLHGLTLAICFANRIPFLPAAERRSLSGSNESKKDCSIEHGKVEFLTFDFYNQLSCCES